MYGVWKGKRHLMVPWLLLQGLLAILLAGLALYYLIIFPNKSDCAQYAGLSNTEAVNHQYNPNQVHLLCIIFYLKLHVKLALTFINIYCVYCLFFL